MLAAGAGLPHAARLAVHHFPLQATGAAAKVVKAAASRQRAFRAGDLNMVRVPLVPAAWCTDVAQDLLWRSGDIDPMLHPDSAGLVAALLRLPIQRPINPVPQRECDIEVIGLHAFPAV